MIFEKIALEKVDSTNTVAQSHIRGDLDHAIVVVADEQSAGRGRLGRTWASPKGNLYCSLLLPPTDDCTVDPRLSFVAANAVYETVSGFVEERAAVSIKWPNDILIHGKKVSGILLEAVNKDNKIFTIAGVGINVVSETVERVPPEIAANVTALHLHGPQSTTRDEVLDSFLKRFDSWYARYRNDGFGPIRKFWNSHCNTIDEKVEIPSRKLEGISKGINDKGQLVLETQHGRIAVDSDEIRLSSQ